MKFKEHEVYIFFKNVFADVASATVIYLIFFAFLALLATIIKNTGGSAGYIVIGSFVFIGSFLFFHARKKFKNNRIR
jgi:hypothetical protein